MTLWVNFFLGRNPNVQLSKPGGSHDPGDVEEEREGTSLMSQSPWW